MTVAKILSNQAETVRAPEPKTVAQSRSTRDEAADVAEAVEAGVDHALQADDLGDLAVGAKGDQRRDEGRKGSRRVSGSKPHASKHHASGHDIGSLCIGGLGRRGRTHRSGHAAPTGWLSLKDRRLRTGQALSGPKHRGRSHRAPWGSGASRGVGRGLWSEDDVVWEDLSLGKTHPFHDETGTQLDQLHRLQATGHNGGIVLATKQHLAELIKLGTKQTFVALLPQLDDASKAMLGVAAHGPFEVILQDKAAGQTYKRITHAIAIHGKFSFTLKDPAAEFHTSEIAELVLEYDSRLVQKSDFDQASSSPVAFFKGHIAKHCPAYKDQITVYGFRHNRHPSASKQDDQLQIILKAPKAARSHLLQISGVDSVLVRDYLEKGITPLDVTVIPKFWPINAKALRELSITAENVPGLAGALMTRRGLAVRAWSKEVAEVRKKLLPADPRLTSSNIHVVPRLVLDSSGWPPGASPADIVEAVNKAVGLPPVPTRTFRSAGVHVWQLGFESPPKVDNFTVKINGDIFQILLAPIAAPEKGSGKGKSNRKAANPKKNADPPAAAAPPGLSSFNSENKRLDVLEARFDSLQGQVTGIEKKQSSIEQKLDSKFEDIGNTLRQLVQLSAQRPHEKSGETPPPKYSKTA
eukprot:g2592.t1